VCLTARVVKSDGTILSNGGEGTSESHDDSRCLCLAVGVVAAMAGVSLPLGAECADGGDRLAA
jgi:hypothetical protein